MFYLVWKRDRKMWHLLKSNIDKQNILVQEL